MTVEITVKTIDPPPVAGDDSYSTNENSTLVISQASGLLANDTDAGSLPLEAVIDSGPVHGTLVLNPNGSFTYAPAASYFGNDSFTYHVSNGTKDSNIATVGLTINEVIPAPVAVSDSYATLEDVTLTVASPGVLANDSDPRARPITAVISAPPIHGTLVLNPDGSFIYNPEPRYFGTDSFSYRASNGSVDSVPTVVNLVVNEVIPPPVASADSYSVDPGATLTIAASGVLSNDSDPRGRPITAGLNAGPAHGTLSLNSNGSFTYTPSPGYTGADSFTYHANNGLLSSNIVTAFINVRPPAFVGLVNGGFEADFAGWTTSGNQNIQSAAPYVPTEGSKLVGFNGANLTPNAILSQTFVTVAGQSYTLAFDLGVLAFNTSSQTMQVTMNGTASLLSKTITVTGVNGSNRWFPQSYSFTADSSSTTLTFRDQSTTSQGLDMTLDNVRVTGPPVVTNTAPVAVADSFTTQQDVTLNVSAPGVKANDSDAESQPLTAYLVGTAAHGTVSMGTNGSFIYTPSSGYYGSDSFTYRVNDGSLNSNVATVNLTVTRRNTAPVALADNYSANQDTALVIAAPGVLSNDTDAQAHPLTAILNSGPAHGTIILNQGGGFTYTPVAGYFGPDSFTYHARDGSLDSNVATASINVVKGNTAPVAVADSYTVNQDTTLDVPSAGVLTNDTDEESQLLTSILNAGPGHGNVTLFTNGRFIYVPNPGYFGPDSFTYHANDGSLNSNVVSVSLTVNMVNVPPVAYADSYSTAQDTVLVIAAPGVLSNDTDANSQPLTAILNAGPGHGTLTLSPTGGFTYTPATGYFGPDSFTYHANDGSLNSNVVTADITVTKAIIAPTAVADAYSTNEGQTLVVPAAGVLTNDTDPQALALVSVRDTGPAHGSLTLNGNGSFTYLPATGYFGSDSFSYHVNNGTLDSAPVTVNLTINEVIPPPVAVADSYSVNKNSSIVVPAAGVLSNDADPRGRPFTAVLNAGPTHGTLNLTANGAFTYTPTTGYTGPDSFTYHASNGYGDSNVATVSITVQPPAFTGLVNGSFESDFTGWTISGNQSIQSDPPYVATQGSKLVGFNGANQTPNAVLSQSFATVAGQSYTVTFDLGVLAYTSSSQTMQLSVDGTGNLINRSITIAGVNGSLRWYPQSQAFTANSTSTTLTFRDQSTSTQGLDMTLDNVVVTGPPPPPNTAPVAVADSYSTDQDVVLTIPSWGVLANDTDAEFQALTAILNAGPGHGSLTLNANGSFTYVPAPGYFGPDSFSYHANDGSLNSNVVSVSLTVNMVNHAPLATNDSYSANQDTVLIVPATGVLANDSDPDLQLVTAVLNIGPGHGTVILNADGSFSYTPSAGYFGPDSFTYHANDGSLDSNIATVSLAVAKANTAPLATSDSYSINQDTTLIVQSPGVLTNDSDEDFQPLTAILNVAPAHGNLVLNANGSFSYTPTSGYFGPDSFTYHANDGDLNSNVVTVSVTVNEVVPPPVAVADSYSTSEGSALVVPASGVLANDSDPRSRPITAVSNSMPLHGTLALNANGSFTYNPNLGYFGNDSFTYHANNGVLNSNVVTVNITVNEVVPPPVAVADSYSTNEGTALVVPTSGVLGNDSDPRSRPLTAVSNSLPLHGTLALNSNGSFTYTPNTGYFGNDSFTYHANNGTLNSNIVTVGIIINEVVPPPVAVADSYSTSEGTPLVVSASGVLANDSDPRSRPLTAVTNSLPLHGTLALNTSGNFTYTPDAGYFGNDTFTYHANNGTLNSNIVAVSITVNEVIPPPVATPDSYATSEGTALVVSALGVLANDSDPRSRPLTAVANSLPLHGTLALNANGSFTYTPNIGYFGSDSFTYHANNGTLDSNIATVSITIDEAVPPPVAIADSYSTNEGAALVVSASGVLANDSDPRSRPLTAALNAGPLHGALVFNPNGSFTYTPTTGYFGNDSFTYHANNGLLDSGITTVSITVNEIIPPPSAVADAFSTNEGTPLVVSASGVLANDSDPRSRPLTVVADTGPAHGLLTLNPNGSFTYTPDTGYFGNDSFTYHANNGTLDSGIATVSITVNEVVPPPVAVADSYTTNEGTALVVSGSGVLANDSDPRSRPLTAVTNSGPLHGTLTLNPNGNFTYTPGVGYFGNDSFTYHANNGSLNSNIVTVNITVNEVIPPPLAVADSYSTNEGIALFISASGVLANDSDPRSRALTAVSNSLPLHGTLALNPNGSFTYTPNVGYFGSDSFTYHANNGFLDSNVVTVAITINQVIAGTLINGSFESGFAGWTTSGNLFTDGSPPYIPTDGALLAGFNAANLTPNAVLSQAVATIPGQFYTLNFDLGVFSFNTNSQTMQVTVNGTNLLLNKTLTIVGNGNGTIRWVPQSFTFMADSSQSLLTFRDQSTTTLGLDMTLDNVRIAESQNTAPVATADAYQMNQNTTLNIAAVAGVLANDTDAQSQVLSAVRNAGPAHGNLTLNPNGSFTYVPTAGYFGNDSFTYHANDGELDSNIVTVTLTIIQVNSAPVAVADSYSTNQNASLVIPAFGVLGNDSDADAQPLTAVLNVGPGHGTLTLNANGGFTYTPVNGYSGADSFTYHAYDGSLSSNIVTVSLTIIPFPTVGLVNGSFESGYTGWTATGNQAIQNAPNYAPTNGSNLVGFNAANLVANGVLSQSFATAPGQICTLAFDAGVFAYNTNSQTLQVTVTGASSLLVRTITLFGPGNGTSLWQSQTYTFVADSSTTTLTFRDQSSSTQAIDLLLDNVRVNSSSSSLTPGSDPGTSTGTDVPGNSGSSAAAPFGVASMSGVPGDITVGMEAVLPGTYFLERSEDLSHWQRISEEVVISPKTIEFHDTGTSPASGKLPPKAFYRIGRMLAE